MPSLRSAEQSFAPEFGSVAAARRFLSAQLEQWDQNTLLWPAQLAVSELATNSVLHAGTEFTISAHLLADGAMRLEVGDGSVRMPRQRRYDVDAATGRGIALIAGLARDWGVQIAPPGKVVWCELVAEADVGATPRTVTDVETADVRLDDWLTEDDQRDWPAVREARSRRRDLLQRQDFRAAA